MKLISAKYNIFHSITHGYFLARPLLEGRLEREVFITIFDIPTKSSTQAFIFIGQKHVFLSIAWNTNSIKRGLYELESSDTLSVQEADGEKLKTLINQPGYERSLSYSTTNPICFLLLNKQYLLLSGIQSENYAKTILNFKTIYLTEKDYIEKQKNLVRQIEAILNKKSITTPILLPGIKGTLAIINIWVVAVGNIVGAVLFVLGLLWFIVYGRR